MKKHLSYLRYLVYFPLFLCCFTACGKAETPYDRYLAATDKLLQAESITINWTETGTITTLDAASNQENKINSTATITLSFAREGKEASFVQDSHMTIEDTATNQITANSGKIYFKDGLLYEADENNPDSGYCLPQEKGFGENFLARFIHTYPASTVASQTSEKTKAGEIISVTFDNEKLSAYLSPENSDSASSLYQTPLQLLIKLDKEGNLKEIHGTATLQTSADSTTARKYTVTYSNYNQTILDFSDFHPENYLLIPNNERKQKQ